MCLRFVLLLFTFCALSLTIYVLSILRDKMHQKNRELYSVAALSRIFYESKRRCFYEIRTRPKISF